MYKPPEVAEHASWGLSKKNVTDEVQKDDDDDDDNEKVKVQKKIQWNQSKTSTKFKASS